MDNKLKKKMDGQKAGRKDKQKFICPSIFFKVWGYHIALIYRKTASYMVWHHTDLAYNVKIATYIAEYEIVSLQK